MHKYFPVDIHSIMLSDTERVKKYQCAIYETVTEQDIVLDVGCGTGILSKFASEKAAKVISIDVSEEATALTNLISKDKIEIATTSSYEYEGNHHPSIVLTETIGQVCFEEYITHICYDLKNRFPSIKTFIPSSLSLYCVIIKSETIDRYIENVYSIYNTHDLLTDKNEYHLQLSDILSRRVYSEEIYDAEVCSPPILLSGCRLGTDLTSDFCTKIDLPNQDAHLHFYFVADMAPGVKLTSKTGDTMTHWRNSFCPNTLKKKRATVKYTSEMNSIHVAWE